MTTLNLRVDPGSIEAGNLGKHTEDMTHVLLDGWHHICPLKPRYRRDGDIIKVSVDIMPDTPAYRGKP